MNYNLILIIAIIILLIFLFCKNNIEKFSTTKCDKKGPCSSALICPDGCTIGKSLEQNPKPGEECVCNPNS